MMWTIGSDLPGSIYAITFTHGDAFADFGPLMAEGIENWLKGFEPRHYLRCGTCGAKF